MRGRFITFEGGEGAGKSTQAAALANRLAGFGIGVVLTREPGGSPGAEVIRHVLLAGVAKPLGRRLVLHRQPGGHLRVGLAMHQELAHPKRQPCDW